MCYDYDGNKRRKTKGRRLIHNINKYCIRVPSVVIGYTAMVAALYASMIMYHRHDTVKTHDSID